MVASNPFVRCISDIISLLYPGISVTNSIKDITRRPFHSEHQAIGY